MKDRTPLGFAYTRHMISTALDLRDSSFDFHPLSHESGVLTSDMICSGKNWGKREGSKGNDGGKPIKDRVRDVVAVRRSRRDVLSPGKDAVLTP